jgi:2-polyprenyl-3-methyl-5-hydroxy-6-metoxy-1,4-benzoquinol methylase
VNRVGLDAAAHRRKKLAMETPARDAEARENAPPRLSEADREYLADVLRCSTCGSSYDLRGDAIVCRRCAASYPIVDGVPILLKDSTIGTHLDHVNVTDGTIGELGQWAEIIKRIGTESTDTMEIGAGTGALTRALLQAGVVSRIVATDVSEAFLRDLRASIADDVGLLTLACDANERHFRTETFDLVVGRSILHHLLDYEVTLQNCCAALKPGGAAVFFEPVLDGKTIVAMMVTLMLQCDEVTHANTFSSTERHQLRGLVRHLLKSKLEPLDRERLASIEDKFIFDIDEMREVGRRAGFSETEYCNNGEVRPAYWPYVERTCQLVGIATEKLDRYRWIGSSFAMTYALMFPERLVTPMGFFVFRK